MAAIKMDELLVTWLGRDDVYEKVLNLIEKNRSSNNKSGISTPVAEEMDKYTIIEESLNDLNDKNIHTGGTLSSLPSLQTTNDTSNTTTSSTSLTNGASVDSKVTGDTNKDNIITEIPPFYTPEKGDRRRTSWKPSLPDQSWKSVFAKFQSMQLPRKRNNNNSNDSNDPNAMDDSTPLPSSQQPHEWSMDTTIPMDQFHKITKEICGFPSFFNGPLYRRILQHAQLKWQAQQIQLDSSSTPFPEVITLEYFQHFWEQEMENYDESDRFFHLVKQPNCSYISKDDFLPFIEELLDCHPGLEFLSNHSEFQEKYAITVITRIFYSVNTCHNGKITCRQIRKSDLLEQFHAVDTEEDINKITRYFSYEHFYVLYCRFWELDHDRDYRITRDDLLKYGEHSLSHMIVDRIFDAAPRPFHSISNLIPNSNTNTTDGNENGSNVDMNSGATGGGIEGTNIETNPSILSASTQGNNVNSRDYLSYEDFIFFMLSEEDKANEISVRYWFSCIDVDGDGKLNNMEMRSFYAVQLHRMQCLGHDIVPFEDMLCQMIDMIKPKSQEHIVVEDFLQKECCQVSGALFDALFNLNKYLQFEQRDPFMERQKREDEFESDWDRFAYIDYNRLAMEEEAREEEAMEIDWVTVDDDDDDDGEEFNSLGLGGASEAPF